MDIRDAYIINKGAIFSQHLAKTESSGIFTIKDMKVTNLIMNNSNGILNFWTAQQVIISSSVFSNNKINASF